MIGLSKHSSAPVAVPSGQYLSIGKAARLLGVSVQSLREYERQGKLRAYRTCGTTFGHRRYRLDELQTQVLGVVADATGESEKICVYARVSSTSQSNAGSLKRQEERMVGAVAEKEGIEKGQIKVYRDVASAFGQREGLNSLVDDLIRGEVRKIYVEFKDRLSRVPALTRLIEHLAKQNGATIIALDREEDVDETKNNLLELIEFVTVLANRTNARKAADRKRKVLTADALLFVRQEIANGRSIRETVQKANQSGLTTEKGEKLSYRVVQRYLNRVVVNMLPVEDARNSFAEFVSTHLKPRKGTKVMAQCIHSAYKLWARTNRIAPISTRKCGDWLRAQNFKHSSHCGFVWYDDLSILGYPSVNANAKSGEWGRLYDNGIRGKHVKYNQPKHPPEK